MALGAVIGSFLSPALGVILFVVTAVFGMRWRVLLVCALTFAVGVLWGWHERPDALHAGTSYRGVVVEAPRWSWSWVTVRLNGGAAVEIRSREVSKVAFGDEVDVACPEPWMRSAQYKPPRCRTAQLDLVAHDRAGSLQTFMYQLRTWLDRTIAKSIPFPEAALLSGILLGGREDLPESIADAFRTSGTSHIVAVSGYNVSIVVALIAASFARLPIPRSARTTMTLGGIALFVLLTGSTASVVRAGLMGSMVLIGRAFGRLGDALHALLLCAAIMVVVSPAVVFDIGFQLSVAATFGLVALSDPIGDRLRFVTERLGIRTSLATTLAAIVVTQPLIMLYFGTVSLVAPIVNIVVLPLIPIAMTVGTCVVATAELIPSMAVYVGWTAWLPLHLIIGLVVIGAQAPFATIALPQIFSVILAALWATWIAWFIGHARGSHAQR